MRLLLTLLAVTSGLTATPVFARPLIAPAAVRLTDVELDTVRGSGLTRAGTIQALERDHFEAFSRQVGTVLPLTFDNWFNDVGDALIIANQLR